MVKKWILPALFCTAAVVFCACSSETGGNVESSTPQSPEPIYLGAPEDSVPKENPFSEETLAQFEALCGGELATDSDGLQVPDADALPAPGFGTLPEKSVFHVKWNTRDGEYQAGTSFLLQTDLTTVPVLATAIHYFGDALTGSELPAYVSNGDIYDILGDRSVSDGMVNSALVMEDANGYFISGTVETDLAAFYVKDTSGLAGLPLAKEPCKPGDVIYLAALLDSDSPASYESCLYPCVVLSDDGGRIDYVLEDRFSSAKISGAPLLNGQGEVVGIHMGSDGSERFGHSAQSIYQMLATALNLK